MDRLIKISNIAVANVPTSFKRYLSDVISWDQKLIGISGARGSGKTILLLQQMKKMMNDGKNALYVSLDDVYFSTNRLVYFAEDFARNGGEYLFLDEVHKYSNWSQELKNIYDSVYNLKVIFTSSSALEIHKGSHDLSRRALIYNLAGLSFREFLSFKYNIYLPVIALKQILENKNEFASIVNSKIKVFPKFKEYLRQGYYPFFNELNSDYLMQLTVTINLVVENDLPAIHKIDFSSIIKLKKLISIISRLTPYTPNIEKLAYQVETTRPTLLKYLYYLDKAQVIKILGRESYGINYLNKPEKIFLGNTNIAYAFSDEKTDIGNIRETFFLNQLSVIHIVTYPKQGDFMVDDKYLFEIGGKSKTHKQIIGIEDSYIAADDIEYGYRNKIPLWLFGFLY